MGLLRAFFQEDIFSTPKSNILWNWAAMSKAQFCRFSPILPCFSQFPRGCPFLALKILRETSAVCQRFSPFALVFPSPCECFLYSTTYFCLCQAFFCPFYKFFESLALRSNNAAFLIGFVDVPYAEPRILIVEVVRRFYFVKRKPRLQLYDAFLLAAFFENDARVEMFYEVHPKHRI